MGDKESYCGKYKDIHVYGYGCMIGCNWYGEYYIKVPRGNSKRMMKVKDSVCSSIEDIKKYIDNNLETLK